MCSQCHRKGKCFLAETIQKSSSWKKRFRNFCVGGWRCGPRVICFWFGVFFFNFFSRAVPHPVYKNPNFVSAVCSEIGRRSSVLWSAVCFLSSYLHSCSPPIIHGNLTCDTIFIQHNGLVKIGSGNHIEKSHEIHFFRKNCVFLLIQLVWFFLEFICCIVRDQWRRIVTPISDLLISYSIDIWTFWLSCF